MLKYRFSDVGEGLEEGEILRWHVEEGDSVNRDDVLLEIETDKAVVDLPSPCAGTVHSREVEAGDIVNVGDVLVIIEELDGESVESPSGEEVDAGTVVGTIDDKSDLLEEEEPGESGPPGTVLATPATRRLARELGVDLEQVEGSGEAGRITESDVRRAADESGEEEVRRTDEHGPVEVEDLRGVRRSIARRVTENHRTIPQVTNMDRADVTRLVELLANRQEEPTGMLPYFVMAVLRCLKEFPRMNARVSMQREEVILRQYYNLGISVDTEHGLMVPVLKQADDRSIQDLAARIDELAEQCRDRSINPDQLKGATFTLTNVGSVGGTWSTPQVNAPQVGILATGRVRAVPVVRQGEVQPGKVLPVSLSFDHRVLDGADAARFTNRFVELLENPGEVGLLKE